MPYVNKKPQARKENLVPTRNWPTKQKQNTGIEWAMNGLGKPFRKIRSKKFEKTVKIKVKLPHLKKKPLAGK